MKPFWPAMFQQRLQATLGPSWPAFVRAMAHKPPVTIRINPDKFPHFKHEIPVPWCQTGYYLPTRPVFALDPLLHAGTYYVQEASSMLIEVAWKQWVSPHPAMRVLDLCAAPGGKSTHLLALMPPDGLLVANEVIHSRAAILLENLTKWGALSRMITRNDPADFKALPGFFDVILVDAPCSGEGLFRKTPQACQEWSEANLTRCVERQRRILGSIWDSLKPGGVLLYSTCTFHPGENEDNLRWLGQHIDAEALVLVEPESNGLTAIQAGDLHGYYAYPHQVHGEGFFFAGLRKITGAVGTRSKRHRQSWVPIPLKRTETWREWLSDGLDIAWRQHRERVHAWPAVHEHAMEQVLQHLTVLQAGLPVAEIHRKEPIPCVELAWSPWLKQGVFSVCEVDQASACQYLRKTELALNGIQGWNLVTFQQQGLGWFKQAGGRCINHYPSDWRLRLPDLPQWSLMGTQ